jgi:hypothetical protein
MTRQARGAPLQRPQLAQNCRSCNRTTSATAPARAALQPATQRLRRALALPPLQHPVLRRSAHRRVRVSPRRASFAATICAILRLCAGQHIVARRQRTACSPPHPQQRAHRGRHHPPLRPQPRRRAHSRAATSTAHPRHRDTSRDMDHRAPSKSAAARLAPQRSRAPAPARDAVFRSATRARACAELAIALADAPSCAVARSASSGVVSTRRASLCGRAVRLTHYDTCSCR